MEDVKTCWQLVPSFQTLCSSVSSSGCQDCFSEALPFGCFFKQRDHTRLLPARSALDHKVSRSLFCDSLISCYRSLQSELYPLPKMWHVCGYCSICCVIRG